MKKATKEKPDWHFYLPHYWLVWCIIFLLQLLSLLPFKAQLALGKRLGPHFARHSKKAFRIANINLKLCYPHLSNEEHQDLLNRYFRNIGIALFETVLAFSASKKRLKNIPYHIVNKHHLDNALAKNKGVLLLGAHYTTLEIAGRLFATDNRISVMYRPHKIGIVNLLIRKALTKYYNDAIPRDDIRRMIRSLKQGKAIWYAADVNVGRKGSVFANFFDIPAATAKAPMRFAKMTGCAVVPVSYFREKDGYEVIFYPSLENFPSDNPEQDAAQINKAIENIVRKKPEQYLWQYMRFKTRPKKNDPKFYKTQPL